MENYSLSIIGFWIPVTLAGSLLIKVIRTTAWWDWVLLAIGVAVNYSTVYFVDGNLHMHPWYDFAIGPIYLFIGVIALFFGKNAPRPALTVLFFLIVGVLVPDLLGIFIQRPGATGTFGGDLWIDGLIVVPLRCFLLYAIPVVFVTRYAKRLNPEGGPLPTTWLEILKHHFRPW